MRLKQGLVKPAVLRTAPGVFEERHATWLELFYDLAFVAAIGQISLSVSADLSPWGLAQFFALFVPVWWAWVGQAFYLSRFDSDDLVHRLLALVQISIVASMAVNIPRAFEGNTEGFALSYAAIRLVLIAQYYVAGRQVPRARPLTKSLCTGFSIAAALWIGSVWVPQPWPMAVWALAVVIDFITPFVSPQLSLTIPPDYSHIPERFGLFTIIVLGEAILAVITGLRAENLNWEGMVVGGCGLLLAFSLWWIYFDGVKGQQVAIPKHARDLKRLQIWLFSHMPLAAGIVIASVGVKHALNRKMEQAMPTSEVWIVGLSVFAVFVTLHAIYWAGLNPKLAKIAQRLSWPHAATSFAALGVVFLGPQLSALGFIGALSGLALLHVFWTFRDLPDVEELLSKVESARRQTAGNV